MISDQAYLWLYLPGQTEPVVCGIVAFDGQDHVFRSARSYLQRDNAIPLAPPNCALGTLDNEEHILDDELNSAIRDASPDAWGRNIMFREHAHARGRSDSELGEIDFLLRAGPDRIGALDATDSSDQYVPKEGHAAPLAELLEAADRIDQGRPLDDQLDAALNHGTNVGVSGSAPVKRRALWRP